MKKVRLMLSLFALFGFSTVQAKNVDPTVSSRTVNYICQSGKTVKVKYGFNRQGLPNYASSYIKNKHSFLPINLDRSDNVATVFGNEHYYTLSSDVMNEHNYRNASIMITAPSQEILFKDCKVR